MQRETKFSATIECVGTSRKDFFCMNVYHELARKKWWRKKPCEYEKKAILRTYHATGGKVDNSLMHRSVESYEEQQKQIIVFRNDASVNCFVFILTVFAKF